MCGGDSWICCRCAAVVLLLLCCCFAVGLLLLLYCFFAAAWVLLYSFATAVLLSLCCCFAAGLLLLLYCCFAVALLLLCCWFAVVDLLLLCCRFAVALLLCGGTVVVRAAMATTSMVQQVCCYVAAVSWVRLICVGRHVVVHGAAAFVGEGRSYGNTVARLTRRAVIFRLHGLRFSWLILFGTRVQYSCCCSCTATAGVA